MGAKFSAAPGVDGLRELPIFGRQYKADPYPYYREWPLMPPFWALADGVPSVAAARFNDVDAIYRDHVNFSSIKPQGPGMEKFDFFNGLQDMVHTDPPVHTRLRSIVAPAFSPRAISAMQAGIQTLVENLMEPILRDGGEVEVMDRLARPLSIQTMLGLLLNVHPDDFAVFENLTKSIALLAEVPAGGAAPPQYANAWQAGQSYCERLLDQRLANNKDDVVGRVIDAQRSGVLSSDEFLVMLMGLFIGGLSTIATQIGNAIVQLASRPEQYALLRADPTLAAGAVEEVMRYDSAGLFNYKFAAANLEFQGLEIPAGTTVYLIHQATGFDPTVFEEPFRFDIRRRIARHLSFGTGIHVCIGAPLARLAVRCVLEFFARRIPELRFASAKPIRYGGWQQERAPEAVSLVLE